MIVRALRGSCWPTDREVSLSSLFKLIVCLRSGERHPSVCIWLASPVLQKWYREGETGQFSERVLWFSISAYPRPYFILACNAPYYTAIRITEPSTGLEVSLASLRDLCVETYLLTRNALSVNHVTCSHVPAVCRRIHRLQTSTSNISAKKCRPVFFFPL